MSLINDLNCNICNMATNLSLALLHRDLMAHSVNDQDRLAGWIDGLQVEDVISAVKH